MSEEHDERVARLETVASLIRGLDAAGFYSETFFYLARRELFECAAAFNWPRTKPDYSFEGVPQLADRRAVAEQGWRSVMSGSDWKERAEKVIVMLRGLADQEACSDELRMAARVELHVLEEAVRGREPERGE